MSKCLQNNIASDRIDFITSLTPVKIMNTLLAHFHFILVRDSLSIGYNM